MNSQGHWEHLNCSAVSQYEPKTLQHDLSGFSLSLIDGSDQHAMATVTS